MILEKSWVGDYQSIRYLAENSTPTLAENWLKRLKQTINQPAINHQRIRKFETIG